MIHESLRMPLMLSPNTMRPLMMMALALGLATAVPLLVLATG